jgi:restriction endonuclease S subunit
MSQRITLNKFAEVLGGITPAPTEDSADGALFIGQSEVGSGGTQLLRRVDLHSDEDLGEPIILRAGDLVLASRDSRRRVLLVTESTDGAVLGRECLAVRLEGSWRPVTPTFLMAWMKTDDFRRQADTLVTGSTMPRLTKRSLASIEVPLMNANRQALLTALSEKFEVTTTALRTTLAHVEELESIELELAFVEDTDDE